MVVVGETGTHVVIMYACVFVVIVDIILVKNDCSRVIEEQVCVLTD